MHAIGSVERKLADVHLGNTIKTNSEVATAAYIPALPFPEQLFLSSANTACTPAALKDVAD